MANAEGVDITFRGIDGNECEAFVVAIREFAFAQGKDEDLNWMLRYATTRLRGRALRWHAKLDPSIRKDWDRFVEALFENYPVVEERDEGGIATPVWTSTTLSPAPSTITLPGDHDLGAMVPKLQPRGKGDVSPDASRVDGSFPSNGASAPLLRPYNPVFQIGRLRIVYEAGALGPHYISSRSSKILATDIQEALIVSFIPTSEPHQILCMNCIDGNPRWLAIYVWPCEKSEFHPISQHGSATAFGPRTTEYEYRDRCISVAWNILSDGTLRATLADRFSDPQNPNRTSVAEPYCTTTAYVEISGASVSFTKDYNTPAAFHPTTSCPIVRARIVFEPI